MTLMGFFSYTIVFFFLQVRDKNPLVVFNELFSFFISLSVGLSRIRVTFTTRGGLGTWNNFGRKLIRPFRRLSFIPVSNKWTYFYFLEVILIRLSFVYKYMKYEVSKKNDLVTFASHLETCAIVKTSLFCYRIRLNLTNLATTLLIRKLSVKTSRQDPIEIPGSFANTRTVRLVGGHFHAFRKF